MKELPNYDEWKLASGAEKEAKEIATCDNCLDDIIDGSDVYKAEIEAELTICSIGCLVQFTAKYDVDIDEFTITTMEAK